MLDGERPRLRRRPAEGRGGERGGGCWAASVRRAGLAQAPQVQSLLIEIRVVGGRNAPRGVWVFSQPAHACTVGFWGVSIVLYCTVLC